MFLKKLEESRGKVAEQANRFIIDGCVRNDPKTYIPRDSVEGNFCQRLLHKGKLPKRPLLLIVLQSFRLDDRLIIHPNETLSSDR